MSRRMMGLRGVDVRRTAERRAKPSSIGHRENRIANDERLRRLCNRFFDRRSSQRADVASVRSRGSTGSASIWCPFPSIDVAAKSEFMTDSSVASNQVIKLYRKARR
jgi:hypothetical protein